MLALPGGFIDISETWQQAAARELWEETGIRIEPTEVNDFCVRSSTTGDGILLICGLARPRSASSLPPFRASEETSEGVCIREPQELAFPLHTEIVRSYWMGARPSAQVH
jgi:8-oxo-dGTP pyrophosphatase MutT (NUDIX family)